MKTTEQFWIYETSPIDMWDGWTDVTRWLRPEDNEEDHEYSWDAECRLNLFLDAVSEIQSNTIYCPPASVPWKVSALPNCESENKRHIFGVKIHNNGTTFIAAPRELPWIDPSYLKAKPKNA